MNRHIREAKYFTGNEMEQFQFYTIPKTLMNSRYKKLSIWAKFLYGMLFDRAKLSQKNNWLDEEGRVYIYYSRESIIEELQLSNKTVGKLFKELVEYNLIEEVRQGLGKPNRIYVLRFILNEKLESTENTKKCISYTSGNESRTFQEMYDVPPSNTNINNTEIINTTTRGLENSPNPEMKIVTKVHGTEKASKMDTNSSTSTKKSKRNKLPNYSTEQIKELQDKFKQITGYEATKEYITEVANECGIKNLEKTINRFNQFRPVGEITSIHAIIRTATRREATGTPYNDNKALQSKGQHNKPSQSYNFEQREYSDEFFDSLYDNF